MFLLCWIPGKAGRVNAGKVPLVSFKTETTEGFGLKILQNFVEKKACSIIVFPAHPDELQKWPPNSKSD